MRSVGKRQSTFFIPIRIDSSWGSVARFVCLIYVFIMYICYDQNDRDWETDFGRTIREGKGMRECLLGVGPRRIVRYVVRWTRRIARRTNSQKQSIQFWKFQWLLLLWYNYYSLSIITTYRKRHDISDSWGKPKQIDVRFCVEYDRIQLLFFKKASSSEVELQLILKQDRP